MFEHGGSGAAMVLHHVARRAPRAFMNSIISRLKIESSLNIAEKRLPQDGRISKRVAGKSFDIRVSTIPTSRGYERIVMRLLNKSSVLLDLPSTRSSLKEDDSPVSSSCTAVYGAMTTLFGSWIPVDPFSASTPMTSKLDDPSWIVWPIGFSFAKRSATTV